MKLQAIFAAVLLSAGSTFGAILFSEDFESPVVTGEELHTYTEGQSFNGWTVSVGSVTHWDANFYPSQGQTLELSSFGSAFSNNQFGTISRTLGTTAGLRYQVSFDAIPHYMGSGQSEIRWGDGWGYRFTGAGPISLVVDAAGADTIRFIGYSGAGGHFIDNVQIQEVDGSTPLTPANVPEPREYALIACVGLLGFAVYRRRLAAA